MFFKIVGLLVLVVVASAGQEGTKRRRRGSLEGKLTAGKLARHSRAKKAESNADKQIHRVADAPRTVTETKHAVPSSPPVSAQRNHNIAWKEAQYCSAGTFVFGDIQSLGGRGLAQIEAKCGDPNTDCDDVNPSTCQWITSGMDQPKWDNAVQEYCPPNSGKFITGIQVYFGWRYGALKMRGICEVPNWESTTAGKRGDPKPAEIMLGEQPDIPDVEPGLGTGLAIENWEAGEKLKCPAGTAVCGLNTQVDETDSIFGTGINEIKVECCPFPAR